MYRSVLWAGLVAISLAATTGQASALAVTDAYSYVELRRNPNGSLDPRLPMFIGVTDIDGNITSATVDVGAPVSLNDFDMLNFGPTLVFGESEPCLEYGAIWRTFDDDVTPFARSGFTMSVSDNSETVTAMLNPLIGANETVEYRPLVSDVTVSGNPLAPTVSWTNPADMSGVDRIRVRVVDTVADTFFTEIYDTIITDLSTTSTTIPEGFLFAGEFQLRVQLEDTEEVMKVIDGVDTTSVRTVNRSTHISDLTVVPLPGSVYMMLSALAAFAWFGRQRLRRA